VGEIERRIAEELGKMAITVSRSHPETVYALIEGDSEKKLVAYLFRIMPVRSGAGFLMITDCAKSLVLH